MLLTWVWPCLVTAAVAPPLTALPGLNCPTSTICGCSRFLWCPWCLPCGVFVLCDKVLCTTLSRSPSVAAVVVLSAPRMSSSCSQDSAACEQAAESNSCRLLCGVCPICYAWPARQHGARLLRQPPGMATEGPPSQILLARGMLPTARGLTCKPARRACLRGSSACFVLSSLFLGFSVFFQLEECRPASTSDGESRV